MIFQLSSAPWRLGLNFDWFEQLKHPIRLVFCPDSEFATFPSKIKAILPKFAICIEDSTSFNSDDSDFYGFWLCWDSKMMKSPKIPWFQHFTHAIRLKFQSKFDSFHIRPPKVCALTKICDFKICIFSWAQLPKDLVQNWPIETSNQTSFSSWFWICNFPTINPSHFPKNCKKLPRLRPTRIGKQNLGQTATSFLWIFRNFH